MTFMTGFKGKFQTFVERQKLFSIPTRISWALAALAFAATVLSVIATAITGSADSGLSQVFEHIAAYTLLLLPFAIIAAMVNMIFEVATKRKLAEKAALEAKAKADSAAKS